MSKKNLDCTPLNARDTGERHTCELLTIMVDVLLNVTKEVGLTLVIAGSGLLGKGKFLLLRMRNLTNESNVPL